MDGAILCILCKPCITLLAFDGLLQVLCEVSGDGHSEVGSGFSESGSTEIKQRYQSGEIKSFAEITKHFIFDFKRAIKAAVRLLNMSSVIQGHCLLTFCNLSERRDLKLQLGNEI